MKYCGKTAERGVHVAVSGQRGLQLILPAPNAMLTKNQHEHSLNLLTHTLNYSPWHTALVRKTPTQHLLNGIKRYVGPRY